MSGKRKRRKVPKGVKFSERGLPLVRTWNFFALLSYDKEPEFNETDRWMWCIICLPCALSFAKDDVPVALAEVKMPDNSETPEKGYQCSQCGRAIVWVPPEVLESQGEIHQPQDPAPRYPFALPKGDRPGS